MTDNYEDEITAEEFFGSIKDGIKGEYDKIKVGANGAERKKERIEAFKKMALGSTALLGAGILYSAGFAIGGDAGFATSVVGGGSGAILGGYLATNGTARFIKNAPKLQKAMICGYNNAKDMHSYAKKKMKPFVAKVVENIKVNTQIGHPKNLDVMKNVDGVEMYDRTVTSKGKSFKNPLKTIQNIWKTKEDR